MATKSNKKTAITDNPEVSGDLTWFSNLDDNVITITESKLENILNTYSKALKAGSDWKTPLGLIIAIITVFLTSEFNKDFLGFNSSFWQAFFFIFLLIFVCWFLQSIALRIIHRKHNIKNLIKLIKNEQEELLESQNVSGLEIVKATYGIEEEGKNIDVTDKLNSMIENDQLVTEATNALVSKDPAPGIVKKLKIQYEYDGEELSKIFNEREQVNLPET